MGFMDKFKDMASQAQGAAQSGMQGMGSAMPQPEDIQTMQEVQRLNQVGVEMPAVIRGLAPTGRTDAGGSAQYEITVEVAPPGAAAYSNTFKQFMHQQTMGGWATEGATVKVKVDPENPASMVLWGGA